MSGAKYGARYEDNFGFYDFEADPDERAFFDHVRRSSKPAQCRRCLEAVRLMPGRQRCARCCEAVEFGGCE
jgi:hypothetical protein